MTKQEKKKNKGNTNKFILVGGVTLFVVVIGVLVFFLGRNPKKNVVLAFDPVVTQYEDGSYHIFAAPRDQKFEIVKSEGFSYEVSDEEGRLVDVTESGEGDSITVDPPEGLYEEGKRYTIKITNGKFANDEFEDSNVVSFSIVRDAPNSYKYKDETKIVKEESVSVTENTLKTDEIYEIDDVVVTEKEEITGAYKISKVNDDGTYEYTLPELSEIYDTFDYYVVEDLDLSGFEVDPEMNEYLTTAFERSILNYFVDDVYAATKVELKDPTWDVANRKIKFTFKIKTDAGDKLFGSTFLKNHDFGAEYEATFGIKSYSDCTLVRIDKSFVIDFQISAKTTFESRTKGMARFRKGVKDALKNEDAEWAKNWLTNDYKKIPEDVVLKDKKLGSIAVPTSVPGLYVAFGTGLLFELDLKASIESTSTFGSTTSIYYHQELFDKSKNGISSNVDFHGSTDFSVAGKAEAKVGLRTDVGFEFVNLLSLRVNLDSGLYADAVLTIKPGNKGSVTGELGFFTKLSAEANALGSKITKKLYEAKLPFDRQEYPFDFGKKEETVSKDDKDKDKVETPAKDDKPVSSDTGKDDDKTDVKNPSGDEEKPSVSTHRVRIYNYNRCSSKTGYDGYSYLQYNLTINHGETLRDYCNRTGYTSGTDFCGSKKMNFHFINANQNLEKEAMWRKLKKEIDEVGVEMTNANMAGDINKYWELDSKKKALENEWSKYSLTIWQDPATFNVDTPVVTNKDLITDSHCANSNTRYAG